MRKVHRYGFDTPYRLELCPLYAKLRAEEPVARVALPYGEEGWLITRHDSVKIVLADERLNRAAVIAAHERTPRSGPIPIRSNPLSAVDPPEHTRLRQPIAIGLGRRQTELYQPRTQQIADELIDDIIAAGPPADFIDAFAMRFPIMSIGEIFGIPACDRIKFREWSIPALSQTAYTKEQIEEAHVRMRSYIASLVARKREQPEDDLLSVLVHTPGEQPFSDEEIVQIVVSLLLNDSVANQLANCLYLLLTHPEQLAWLQAHMSELPQAVEELLRFAPMAPDTPAGGHGHIRMALSDLTVNGVTIRAGDFVLPSIISANRDEQVFVDAHKLDLTRSRNPHIAFGHGFRRCPGDKVGRMQMQVAIGSLVRRFPGLGLAVPLDDIPWKVGMITRSPTKLPVRW